MIQAKDLMKRQTPMISFDGTVNEAIQDLSQSEYDFAVVVASTQDRIQGVITEAILMRIYLKYQTQTDKDALIFYRESFEPAQLVLENEEFPMVVKKVMTAVGHRVFVINETGQVVGFIRAKDILPYFNDNFKLAKAGQKIAMPNSNELQSDLYLFETFFTQSPFLMHSVNKEGIIQMANEMLHRVLGYEYGELIGLPVFAIYPKENHDKVREGLENIFQKTYVKVIQADMVKKDRTHIMVEMMSRALLDQNKEVIGTITVSRPQDMAYLMDCLLSQH